MEVDDADDQAFDAKVAAAVERRSGANISSTIAVAAEVKGNDDAEIIPNEKKKTLKVSSI